MNSIDLRQYVVAPTGGWFQDEANFQPTLLRLLTADDGLTLVGPLRVRLCILAVNRFTQVTGLATSLQSKDIWSYTLEIPPGQSWTYPMPMRYAALAQAGQPVLSGSPGGQGSLSLLGGSGASAGGSAGGGAGGTGGGGGGLPINVNVGGGGGTQPAGGTPGDTSTIDPSVLFLIRQSLLNRSVIGANAGAALVIRPAGPDLCGDPCAELNPCNADPCAPKRSCGCNCGCSACSRGGCGCGGSCSCSQSCNCGGCANTSDLPCDFAVRGQSTGTFFPSPCEPCAPGAPVSMPPAKGPALLVRPAAGGTIRTRFYTGMHISKEDFETDQKNARLKRALMNRVIGQGVAWGFGVGFDGDAVCVTPGYGLDCCGNDVILSSAYRVDAASLVADPAAANLLAMPGPQRFHLVLEYFECPQDVRPVHGDPCTLDGARCEPSRIRETARLRLAPPCDMDDSGPIKDFLAEIEALRADPLVGPLLAPQTTGGTVGGQQLSAVPFTIELEFIGTRPGGPSADSGQPTNALGVPATGQPDAQGDAFEQIPVGVFLEYSVRITVTAQGGYTFTQSGAPTPIDVTTGQPLGPAFALSSTSSASQVVWEIPFPKDAPINVSQGGPIPPQYIHRFSGWQIQDPSSNASYTGSVDIRWTKVDIKFWEISAWGEKVEQGGVPGETVPNFNIEGVIHLDIPPGQISAVGLPPPFPCLGEACDPKNRTFWNTFPWLHANPENPNQAADWRVLVLAVLYAALAGEMARSGYGTPSYVKSNLFELLNASYLAAWKVFFGTVPDTDRFSLTDALQKLLQTWCRSLLYPGPTCHCCPHGVVIGCAVVDGGTITSVDPWGGRRWVVTYPLLSYWGQEFGLMPLDAIASRLFDMICCFSALAEPKFPVKGVAGNIAGRDVLFAPGVRPTEPLVGRTSAVQFGPATLVVGDPSEVAGRLATLGPARAETLDPITFVTRVASMVGLTGSASPGTTLVDYSVLAFPGIHFVAPDVSGGTAAAGAAPAPAPPAVRKVGQFGTLVTNEVAGATSDGTVPMLLRPVVDSLAFSIAGSLPLTVPAELRAPFASAGIDTVGRVLDRNPEQVLGSILKGRSASTFSTLLDTAESTVRSVVKVVVDATGMAARDEQLTARADLKDPLTAKMFTQLVSDRLKAAKIDVSPAAVATAVAEAAQG